MAWVASGAVALAFTFIAAPSQERELTASTAYTASASDWLEQPTKLDELRSYPQLAMYNHVSGSANLVCKVDVEGQLTACRATDAVPRTYGFDKMALSLSAKYRLVPALAENLSASGKEIIVPFNVAPPKISALFKRGKAIGDDAVINVPLAKGVRPPPGAARCPEGNGRCLPEAVTWVARPDKTRTASILSRAGWWDGMILADCTIDTEGWLKDCRTRHLNTRNLAPLSVAALETVLLELRAEPLTKRGSPTVGARVYIAFISELLREGLTSEND